jgi:endonuclease III
MQKPEIVQILDLLVSKYGNRKLKPHRKPVAELVQTILSQNTSDLNSRPAFRSLIASFPTWKDIIQADPTAVAEAIKRGGLGQIKTVRIQRALREIKRIRGSFNLDFLQSMPVPEARKWLRQLPGVGNKTANCVLLFSFGKPAFPVDTHIFRISKRLGLIHEKTSLDEAHVILERRVPPEHMYEFHILMIEHGRRVCLARNPLCAQCVLSPICPSCNIQPVNPIALKKVKHDR